MRTKLLFTLLCVLVPAISNAEIIYRVEQIDMAQTEPVSSNNIKCCPKCKYPIKFDTKYCLRCGHQLTD